MGLLDPPELGGLLGQRADRRAPDRAVELLLQIADLGLELRGDRAAQLLGPGREPLVELADCALTQQRLGRILRSIPTRVVRSIDSSTWVPAPSLTVTVAAARSTVTSMPSGSVRLQVPPSRTNPSASSSFASRSAIRSGDRIGSISSGEATPSST